MGLHSFPLGFIWGAATSSYQIEGAWDADGKGESIWDRFTHLPFHIQDGATGDVACDHYHRMPEDVALMKALRLQSYRFSISWPRLLPEGTGKVNPKGIDFYDRLIDHLLDAGISPMATLYHWDLPQALEDRGGWLNRDSAQWFADYARLAFDRLGDRVAFWATFNEPWVVAFMGYGMGIFAPGLADTSAAYQANHHLLLAHGQAVEAFHQGKYPGQIGIVLDPPSVLPASESEADVLAHQRVQEAGMDLFISPILNGIYPAYLFDWIGRHRPKVASGDLEIIHQPIDFLGINYYATRVVSFHHEDGLLRARIRDLCAPGWGKTAIGWGINPPGLPQLLLTLKQKYPNLPPLYITENGAPFEDVIDANGTIHDPARLAYLRAHLLALHDAIQAGVDVRGYYYWSLLDNFEWAKGYRPRFGIVHVDYATQKRTPKASARWYAEVIGRNAVED